jgi:hypothetical protein
MTIDSITTDIESIKKFIAGIEEQPKEAEVKPEEGAGAEAVAQEEVQAPTEQEQ